jgi:CHAT domain-containing protein
VQAGAASFPAGSTRVLLGRAASERNLRGESLSRYGIVHFATHGLVREEIPGLQEAALVLTPVDEADPLDDGLLTATEIAGLGIAARLVILSACNTARVDPRLFGDQVHGLAAAFAMAGVPATVATLWAVDSPSAQDLMQRFLSGVSRSPNGGAAEALARAQRSFRESARRRPHQHPRFWAAFVASGDASAAPGTPDTGG